MWGLTFCDDQDLSGIDTEHKTRQLLQEIEEAQTDDVLLMKDLDNLGNQIQAWFYEIGNFFNKYFGCDSLVFMS